MRGSISNINHALSKLIYTPKPFWNSQTSGEPDILRLFANDLGNTGNETIPLTASTNVLIFVEHVSYHLPRFRLPGATYRTFPCERLTGQIYGEVKTLFLLFFIFYILF